MATMTTTGKRLALVALAALALALGALTGGADEAAAGSLHLEHIWNGDVDP